MTVRPLETIDIKEAVELGATDSGLFNRVFFPKTARLETPQIHREVDTLLDSTDRYVNILMSRGWAKTSKLRMYTGKRIAYNISRTIMYVGASERHTKRSIRWIRNQVDKNKLFADTFKLRRGKPWTDEECCIMHDIDDMPIWLVGVGITSGSARGVNFDDHRPDLIILDDVMNDENAATKEGREKVIDLVFGAFKESLAPRSEAPFAKICMLNTPQDFNDISQLALKDKQFVSKRFGCWTTATEDAPLEVRQSAWPELITSEELREEYRAAAARNRLSIFIREKECKLTSPENSAFKAQWLRFFGEGEEEPEPPLDKMWTILVIDPTPPPSEVQLSKGLVDSDYEALTVLGRYEGKVFILETSASRGSDPNWTSSEFFRLVQKWRCRKALIESVVYQRTLVWYLREQMRKAGTYTQIDEFGRGDKRSKTQKILDGITGIASNHQLFARKEQVDFISQYTNFSTVRKIGHDDVLETVAIGCTELLNGGLNVNDTVLELDESQYKDLDDYRGAP